MAYTNTWNTTSPAGSVAAKLIDDHIRQLRLDLQERMLALVVNMTDDPVIVLDAVRGVKTGKKLIISASEFYCEPETEVTYAGLYADVNSAAGVLRAPFSLPSGVSIKKIRWLLDNNDTAVLTVTLKSSPFSVAAAVTTANTQTKATTGLEIKDSGAISIAVNGTDYYWLEADKSSGASFRLYAVEITYDTPDSRSTY